jgi:IS1 family transposase
MRINEEKALQCLKMLLEGASIRSVTRFTKINCNTIIRLLEFVGLHAQHYWMVVMQNLPANNVQLNGLYGFVAMKEETYQQKQFQGIQDIGDAYCLIGIERDTKLVLAWRVGRREPNDAVLFSDKLQRATKRRFQLSSDGFCIAVPEVFSGNIDFTHIERGNLSLRMAIRRRTSLAFSKKWENYENHLAIWFLYYNFCQKHALLKTTPAIKAGLTDHIWNLYELLKQLVDISKEGFK